MEPHSYYCFVSYGTSCVHFVKSVTFSLMKPYHTWQCVAALALCQQGKFKSNCKLAELCPHIPISLLNLRLDNPPNVTTC